MGGSFASAEVPAAKQSCSVVEAVEGSARQADALFDSCQDRAMVTVSKYQQGSESTGYCCLLAEAVLVCMLMDSSAVGPEVVSLVTLVPVATVISNAHRFEPTGSAATASVGEHHSGSMES